ncbi:MAG: nucleoside deaminase [Muribaculaceae bacterium]|nr:nucleoside deaminase [Muribaculaceae bacterium]
MNAPEALDERCMMLALAEARRAASMGEVPIGAVVTAPDGSIIGRGHNLTETLHDVTAHAEMQAITAATATLGSKYLDGCTLYVTVEPCVMCAGAIGWSHLARIVAGAPDPKGGYSTFTSRSPFHPRAIYTSGVLADECRALMQDFFRRRRKK